MLHCVYNRILNLACRIFVSVNMKWCTKWALTLFKEETQLFSEKKTHTCPILKIKISLWLTFSGCAFSSLNFWPRHSFQLKNLANYLSTQARRVFWVNQFWKTLFQPSTALCILRRLFVAVPFISFVTWCMVA